MSYWYLITVSSSILDKCKQTAASQNDLLVDQDSTSENDVEWVCHIFKPLQTTKLF